MTFYTFIQQYRGKRQRNHDHPYSGLALMMEKDRREGWPELEDREKLSDLYTYLTAVGCSQEMLDIFIKAWEEYKRTENDTGANLARIAKSLEHITGLLAILCDVQDEDNPLLAISDSIDDVRNKLADVTGEWTTDRGHKYKYLRIAGSVDTDGE